MLSGETMSYERMLALVQNPFGKLAIVLVTPAMKAGFHGAALLGTLAAAYLAFG